MNDHQQQQFTGAGFVVKFDVDPTVKFFAQLKNKLGYDHSKGRPRVISKTMGDGTVFEINRVDTNTVYVVYHGCIEDIGQMRFLIDNIYDDLAECGLVSKRQPDYVASGAITEPVQQTMIS